MDIKEESILGQSIVNHWYYVAKGRALRKFLSGISVPSVLDVGAGSGIFSRQLLDIGTCDSAICVDLAYPQECDELHYGKPIAFRKDIKDNPHRLILMMDVLEHVDDDLGLLKYYTDTMPSGGYVLITVPAFQWLWSGHDVFLEHKRRYTLQGLETVVRQSKLEIIKSRYFFGALFPMIVLIRWFARWKHRRQKSNPQSDLSTYPPILNQTLVGIHDVERYLMYDWNRFAGLSIFCLARRR